MPTPLAETGLFLFNTVNNPAPTINRRALVGMALDAQLGRSYEEIAAMRQITHLIGVLINPESSLTQAISGHKWKPDAFNRDPIVRRAHKVMTARINHGLFQSGIHSFEENPADVSRASKRLISQLRKEQTEKGTVLQAFQKLQEATDPEVFWNLIQRDEEVGTVVLLFSQTLLGITQSRYTEAEALVASNNTHRQPVPADGTIFSPHHPNRVTTSLLTRLALTAAALSLVLTACGGGEVKQPHDLTIMSLPQPTQTVLLSEGGETLINRSAIYGLVKDYCEATGCDIASLLPLITLSDKPDPNKLLHMATTPDGKMIIYSTSTIFQDAGPFFHEFSHLDVNKTKLPESIAYQMGSSTGEIYAIGFGIEAPEFGEGSLYPSLEEAAAEAIKMMVGEKQGVYFQPDLNKGSYGNIGLFLLRLAGQKGISNEDFIKLHRESDLFGFIERLTGKPDDLIGFQALYATLDEMRVAMQNGVVMTVDKAMKEYELFLKEYEKIAPDTQGAFFRLPWNQTDNFAFNAWKRIVRGHGNPSMEVALANKYVRQKDQRDNLAATLPKLARKKTLFHT